MASSKKIKEADNVLSLFIRLFYSENGYVACFTCDNRYKVAEMQNGHFIPRANMSVRFSIANCFPQCKNCNEFKGGNEGEYRKILIDKFGENHVEFLERKKNEVKQWADYELDELITKLKDKIKIMQNRV